MRLPARNKRSHSRNIIKSSAVRLNSLLYYQHHHPSLMCQVYDGAWRLKERILHVDLFISITRDSYLMFIYSQKHVQSAYFHHHVTPVFHRRTRQEISSMSSSPVGMFISDATSSALELMMFIMPCWRVEHECLVSFSLFVCAHAIPFPYLNFISAASRLR